MYQLYIRSYVMVHQSVFCHCDKIPETINLKGEIFILLTISEILIHVHLILLFSAWGSMVYHGLIVTRKKKIEIEKSKGTPSMN
jgi:hypothetical protein